MINYFSAKQGGSPNIKQVGKQAKTVWRLLIIFVLSSSRPSWHYKTLDEILSRSRFTLLISLARHGTAKAARARTDEEKTINFA
jgi:hypothetical protein